MEVDLTIREAIQSAKEKLKAKGIDIAEKEILEIFESQFIAAQFAFSKGIDVRLPYFGVFKRTSKEVTDKAKELFKGREKLSKEEIRLRSIEVALLATEVKEKKKRRKPLTVIDLLEVKNKHNQNNRYNKL